jgi:hypothetical protein
MRINTKTLYKGSDTTEKTKLLSVSLFRTKRGYRGFNKYLEDSIRLVEQVTRILPDWILRFYIDESVKEEEYEKLKHSSVQILEYKCEDFWDSEIGTHEGYFGTFIRFLPMFSAQKYKVMISCDVDIADFWLEYFKYLDKNVVEVGLINQLCHNDWTPEYLDYSILAGGMYSKLVFPRQILTDFLKNLKEKKFSLKIIKQTDTETYIPYGTDEYFLTTRLYMYLQEHKVKVMTLTIATVIGAIEKIVKSVVDKDRKKLAMAIVDKARFAYSQFWKDPRKLRPDIFVKDLNRIIKIVEPEFQLSRHRGCILDYLEHPKLTRLHKYNY